jgi:hypothetical protein
LFLAANLPISSVSIGMLFDKAKNPVCAEKVNAGNSLVIWFILLPKPLKLPA